jgi:hypothetical protein
MKATFYPRDLSQPIAVSVPLDFQVVRYSKKARGGCYEAVIAAAGAAADLWRLLDWCRVRVEIATDGGERVWWGYVRKVEVRDGNVRATADVGRMTNRVAVAYTLTANGQASTGARQTTAWAEDAVSIAEFGRRELLDSQGGTSEAAALARRASLLAAQRYPVGLVQVDAISRANAGEPAATLTCEGWWWTLDWLYASVPTQLVASFETIGALEGTLGRDYNDDAANVTRLAQIITTGANAWNLLQIGAYVKRVGLPEGGLAYAVTTLDENDEPAATVASGSLEPAEVPTDYAWTFVTLPDAVELAAGTRYAVQLSTAGTPNADNYYSLLLDGAQGYAGGTLKQYVSAWSEVAADLPFRLRTDELVASDVQILNLCRAYGQFFRRVDVDGVTGLALESYRNGDNDALYEVEELMDAGTASGARLLAEVDPERQVRVFAQPGEDSAAVYLRGDGQFYHRNTERIDPATCPVGFWARLSSVVPPGADVSRISGLGAFFVEEAEYDAARGVLTYTPLGAEDLFRFGPEAG